MTEEAQAGDEIGRRLLDRGWAIGAAESLTAGSVACALGAAADAGRWFNGAIVAYSPEVKFSVLGVAPGPVVTAACAAQMAAGAASLLGADIAVATTGVGGPGEEENKPPGTVFVAVWLAGRASVEELRLEGGPAEVVAEATRRALAAVLAALR